VSNRRDQSRFIGQNLQNTEQKCPLKPLYWTIFTKNKPKCLIELAKPTYLNETIKIQLHHYWNFILFCNKKPPVQMGA